MFFLETYKTIYWKKFVPGVLTLKDHHAFETELSCNFMVRFGYGYFLSAFFDLSPLVGSKHTCKTTHLYYLLAGCRVLSVWKVLQSVPVRGQAADNRQWFQWYTWYYSRFLSVYLYNVILYYSCLQPAMYEWWGLLWAGQVFLSLWVAWKKLRKRYGVPDACYSAR